MTDAVTSGVSAAVATDRAAPPRAKPQVLPVILVALLFAAVVPWRAKTFFEGQLDPVVAAKGVLTVIALAVALVVHGRGPRRPVPFTPLFFLCTYLGVSMIGALTGTTLMPTAVVSVRVLLVAWALTLTVATYGVPVVTASLVRVLQIVVAAGVLTGIGTVTSGRLRGGFPPLNPNELALLSALCLLWCISWMLRAEERLLDYVGLGWFLGIIFLSGSRTTLLAALVAIGVMLLRAQRLSRRALAVAMAAIPLVGYVLLATDVVSSVLGRGGTESISTLSNRTIAWRAALQSQHAWNDSLFGRGLSVKKVEVPGQWWNSQILDSSWVSALVQAGYLGMAVLVIWVICLLVLVLRTDHAWATLWVGLAVCLAARSSLESGLFDASTSFLVFWLVSLACWSHQLARRGLSPPDLPLPVPTPSAPAAVLHPAHVP